MLPSTLLCWYVPDEGKGNAACGFASLKHGFFLWMLWLVSLAGRKWRSRLLGVSSHSFSQVLHILFKYEGKHQNVSQKSVAFKPLSRQKCPQISTALRMLWECDVYSLTVKIVECLLAINETNRQLIQSPDYVETGFLVSCFPVRSRLMLRFKVSLWPKSLRIIDKNCILKKYSAATWTFQNRQ